MWKNSIIFSGITLMLLVFSINSLNNDVGIELLLENSRPHIGAVYPSEIGIGGETIKIAVIDTGVNFCPSRPFRDWGRRENCLRV